MAGRGRGAGEAQWGRGPSTTRKPTITPAAAPTAAATRATTSAITPFYSCLVSGKRSGGSAGAEGTGWGKVALGVRTSRIFRAWQLS